MHDLQRLERILSEAIDRGEIREREAREEMAKCEYENNCERCENSEREQEEQ